MELNHNLWHNQATQEHQAHKCPKVHRQMRHYYQIQQDQGLVEGEMQGASDIKKKEPVHMAHTR